MKLHINCDDIWLYEMLIFFAETMNAVNNTNSNRGNSDKASRYKTHKAYNTELYKPMNMNTNPSIYA
jgi:hypothetical protein